MFTRQHYEFIARAVRELKSASARSEIADVLARRFAQDNDGFRKERFLKAASAATLLEEAGLTRTDELAEQLTKELAKGVTLFAPSQSALRARWRASAAGKVLDSDLDSTGGVK